ncbi:MAG: hypothetical protein L6R35_004135 [Caloplaca aegaea]|nr:MAG: hypothetical protein L6R35_004135 [Caloplaca aegaea]
MSWTHKIILVFVLSFILHTVTNASPHADPQRNRHRHRPAAGVVEPEVIPSTTTIVQGGRGAGGGSGGNSEPTAVPDTGTGTGKRGLAYNSSSPPLDVFSDTKITWVHDWYSLRLDAPSGFEFVPTLWGDQPPHSDNWAQNAAGHEYLMSFNEPDIISQADMTVGDAVAAYSRLMFPLRSNNVKIGAPSVSSGSGNNERGIPMGTAWLGQFLNQCNDPNTCVADFVSGHWYGCPTGACTVQADVDSFTGYVSDLVATAAGRDVWIPEFQRFGDVAGQMEFLERVMPALDGNDAVKRYAYFMVVDGILTTNGRVSSLGKAFAG